MFAAGNALGSMLALPSDSQCACLYAQQSHCSRFYVLVCGGLATLTSGDGPKNKNPRRFALEADVLLATADLLDGISSMTASGRKHAKVSNA